MGKIYERIQKLQRQKNECIGNNSMSDAFTYDKKQKTENGKRKKKKKKKQMQ